MARMTRIAVALAAAASLAAGAAPASASEAAAGQALVCDNQINVPSCVDWTFDVAIRTVDYVQREAVPIAQRTASMAACLALEVSTGRDCPEWPPPSS